MIFLGREILCYANFYVMKKIQVNSVLVDMKDSEKDVLKPSS